VKDLFKLFFFSLKRECVAFFHGTCLKAPVLACGGMFRSFALCSSE